MYAVVMCPGCRKYRMIDCRSASSDCPFCRTVSKHNELRKYFESEDQTEVRNVLAQATGYIPEKKDRSRIENADPLSTLHYRYEHCQDLDEKMEILSAGLTDIHGTFTLEDVEEFEPKNAKKMLTAMLDACIVAEIRPGKYKG